MRSPEEIAARLAATIRDVYRRPSMFSGRDGVESTLWDFHWAWAIVHESEDRFMQLKNSLYVRERASGGLRKRFREDHPDAPDDEALEYVLDQWRGISRDLSVPLDERGGDEPTAKTNRCL